MTPILKSIKNFNFSKSRFNRKHILLGICSGLVMGFSFPPFPFPYLIFAGLIPYLIVLEKRETLGGINRFTYFVTFIFNLITLYWVGSWTPEADTFLMISGVLLLFFNPITFLIPSTLYYYSRKVFGKNISIFLLPLFWVFYEYIYSVSDFRFPWLSLGNGLPYFQSFIQITDLIGVYGLTFLIVLLNVLFYLSLKTYLSNGSFSIPPLVGALLIIVAVILYGNYKLNHYESAKQVLRVGIIQPNLNPWNKWEAGNLDEQLDMYLELSGAAADSGAQLIIWPETALPVYLLSGGHSEKISRIHEFVNSRKTHLLTGMPDAKFYYDSTDAPPEAKPTANKSVLYTSYNSILFFEPDKQEVAKYKKNKLVPFGEHVPLVEEIPFLGDLLKWNVGISSWNIGKDTTVFPMSYETVNGDEDFGVAGVVCIESIYADFVAAFVNHGANLIAVVTNDSWYGNSSGPYQHQLISVLRAVENRRTVIRCANGGISCIIDPLGNTLLSTELFTKRILVGNAGIYRELTFFSRYPLLIPIISVIISILTLLSFLFIKLKEKFS